jgi:hypothetical protein
MTTRLPRLSLVAVALAGASAPRIAAACAACVSSAYGDRSFNWGYGALLAAPFLVAIVVVAVLGWNAGYRLRWRRPALRPSAPTGPIPVHEETS